MERATDGVPLSPLAARRILHEKLQKSVSRKADASILPCGGVCKRARRDQRSEAVVKCELEFTPAVVLDPFVVKIGIIYARPNPPLQRIIARRKRIQIHDVTLYCGTDLGLGKKTKTMKLNQIQFLFFCFLKYTFASI